MSTSYNGGHRTAATPCDKDATKARHAAPSGDGSQIAHSELVKEAVTHRAPAEGAGGDLGCGMGLILPGRAGGAVGGSEGLAESGKEKPRRSGA